MNSNITIAQESKVVQIFHTVIHNPCHIVQPGNTHHLLYLSFPSFPTESNADQDQDHTPHATGQRKRPSIRSRRSKKQIVMQSWSLAVMRLLDLLSLSLEVLRGGGGGSEVAGEDGLEEGSEDDLGASGLGKSHPEDEDELEGVVEWEPVDGVDGALKEAQESINNPVRKPLSIIGRLGGEQRI